MRREPLHPGAQTSLFPSLDYRFWGQFTDRTDSPVEADVHLRAHAHVEDHIRRLKGSGLERFPFTDLDANRAWMALVCFAADLVRWFQLLCLRGPLAAAEPKTLRWQLWHTPARVVRHARQTHRAHPRRLAERRRIARRLPTHRAHHLSHAHEPELLVDRFIEHVPTPATATTTTPLTADRPPRSPRPGHPMPPPTTNSPIRPQLRTAVNNRG